MEVLVKNQLTPDEYVYLHFLATHQLCPILLNISKEQLQEKGFIKIVEKGVLLRQKGIELFKEVIEKAQEEMAPTLFGLQPMESKLEEASKDLTLNVDNWIDEWRNLFPRGVQTGGYPVRGTKSGCIAKMSKFIKANKGVTKELIFSATQKYVAEHAARKYQYMKLADYFIEKDKASLLETYIELIVMQRVNSGDEELIPPSSAIGGFTPDLHSNPLADDI